MNLDEEVRCDFIVTKERKKIWNIEMEILKKLLEVCKKYNLKVFADGGTLIGVIRHEGFIPWDDDIDLVMLRNDYNKLCDVASKEFDDLYFFQTEQTDPSSMRGHIQIRKSDTTAILDFEKDKGYKFNQGIFIDIFPLDKVPNNPIKKKIFLKHLSVLKRKAEICRNMLYSYERKKGIKGLIKELIYKIVKIKDKGSKKYYLKYFNKFEKKAQKYKDNKKYEYISNIVLNPSKKKGFYKLDCYAEGARKKFEDIEILVPKKYETVLDGLYDNWRVPIKANSVHGQVIFDCEKSYKQYLS